MCRPCSRRPPIDRHPGERRGPVSGVSPCGPGGRTCWCAASRWTRRILEPAVRRYEGGGFGHDVSLPPPPSFPRKRESPFPSVLSEPQTEIPLFAGMTPWVEAKAAPHAALVPAPTYRSSFPTHAGNPSFLRGRHRPDASRARTKSYPRPILRAPYSLHPRRRRGRRDERCERWGQLGRMFRASSGPGPIRLWMRRWFRFGKPGARDALASRTYYPEAHERPGPAPLSWWLTTERNNPGRAGGWSVPAVQQGDGDARGTEMIPARAE